MAENPIGKDALMNFEEVEKELLKTIALLEKMAKVMSKDLVVAADKLTKAMKGASGATKEGQTAIKAGAAATDKLASEKKELTKIEKQSLEIKTRLNLLRREARKEIELNIKAEKAAVGSVNKLKQEIGKLKKGYDDLGPKAARKARQEIEALNKQLNKATPSTGRLGSAIKKAQQQLLLMAGGLTAVFRIMKNTLTVLKDFTSAQSELQALSGSTREELAGLTDQAKQLGGVTEFTAIQITKLQTELVKLGFATREIQLSTKNILNFASATGADLSDAAKTAAVALRIFGLDASRMDEVVSTLAVSTTKSALTFADFETILSTAGPVLKAFGFSLQDLVAFTGRLRDAGFDASKAATATRNIFLNLADANGVLAQELGGAVSTSEELIDALVDLDDRGIDLATTLEITDKRSVAAFNTFLTGAETIRELKDSVTDVNDELQIMVDLRLDNLAGDITRLGSAWEGFVLKAEGGVNAFRTVVQFLSDATIKLANLDLIFTRDVKLTEDQVTRSYDVLLAITDKKAQAFQKLISESEDATEDELKAGLKNIGFSRKEVILLWDEFLKRRKEQIALEATAEADRVQAELDAAEKEEKIKGQAKLDATEKLQTEINDLLEKARENNAESEIENTDFLNKMEREAEELANKSIVDDKLETFKLLEKAEKESRKKRRDDMDEDLRLRLKAEEEALREELEFRRDLIQRSQNLINSFTNILEGAKQRELSAAGQSAEERAKIEEKFAKKQQQLAIGQATVNAALAITQIWARWAHRPVKAGILTAIAAGTLAGEIAIIKNQKFAKGGSFEVEGNTHASGGTQIMPGVEAEKGEYVSIFSRKATANYGTDMLEGITNSVNSGQFHEVWSNLNTQMAKTDPYTKKMYELMMKTPTIFSHEGKIHKFYPGRERMN